MSDSASSASSSPPSSISTLPSSVPSPELGTVKLAPVSEEDKAEAAKLKAGANKAFSSGSQSTTRSTHFS